MQFIVGSMNKAKVEAVTKVIAVQYPNADIHHAESVSGVRAQPIGDEETIEGAVNRAIFIRNNHPNTIGIGLEGGVRTLGGEMYICNWGALALPGGEIITAGGAQIRLPNELSSEISKGKELGPVMERYFDTKGLRQKEGAMGIFTAGVITRVELFAHIMQLLIGQMRYQLGEKKD